jgi:hypothetical protein
MLASCCLQGRDARAPRDYTLLQTESQSPPSKENLLPRRRISSLEGESVPSKENLLPTKEISSPGRESAPYEGESPPPQRKYPLAEDFAAPREDISLLAEDFESPWEAKNAPSEQNLLRLEHPDADVEGESVPREDKCPLAEEFPFRCCQNCLFGCVRLPGAVIVYSL